MDKDSNRRLDDAIDAQADAFALYRDLVDHVAHLKGEGLGDRRQIRAAQMSADAAYSDYRFARADVERAVRAAMPGADERAINDRLQAV